MSVNMHKNPSAISGIIRRDRHNDMLLYDFLYIGENYEIT